MDGERVAPTSFDGHGAPQEGADLRGKDVEPAAHEREAGETALEQRALALQLTATVDEEADEGPLQDARIDAREAERRDPLLRGRGAQLLERRIGDGRVRQARPARPRCPPASSRTPETRARASVVVSSRRSVAVGATTSRSGRRDDDHVSRLEDVEGRHARPEHAHPGDGAPSRSTGGSPNGIASGRRVSRSSPMVATPEG